MVVTCASCTDVTNFPIISVNFSVHPKKRRLWMTGLGNNVTANYYVLTILETTKPFRMPIFYFRNTMWFFWMYC